MIRLMPDHRAENWKMPIVYQINRDKGYTIAAWHGLVNADEYEKHVHQLVTDESWPPEKSLHLSDLRRAKLDDSFTEEVLIKSAKIYGERLIHRRIKLAIIAEATYKKASIFEKSFMNYQPSAIVFHDLQSACLWLGLDHDEVNTLIEKMIV